MDYGDVPGWILEAGARDAILTSSSCCISFSDIVVLLDSASRLFVLFCRAMAHMMSSSLFVVGGFL